MAEEKIKGRRPDITGVIGDEKVALWLSDDFRRLMEKFK